MLDRGTQVLLDLPRPAQSIVHLQLLTLRNVCSLLCRQAVANCCTSVQVRTSALCTTHASVFLSEAR